tara:strand:- start:963 stop:1364 length:402 start_codon:yes stop_codon:yes gene_type:complete
MDKFRVHSAAEYVGSLGWWWIALWVVLGLGSLVGSVILEPPPERLGVPIPDKVTLAWVVVWPLIMMVEALFVGMPIALYGVSRYGEESCRKQLIKRVLKYAAVLAIATAVTLTVYLTQHDELRRILLDNPPAN